MAARPPSLPAARAGRGRRRSAHPFSRVLVQQELSGLLPRCRHQRRRASRTAAGGESRRGAEGGGRDEPPNAQEVPGQHRGGRRLPWRIRGRPVPSAPHRGGGPIRWRISWRTVAHRPKSQWRGGKGGAGESCVALPNMFTTRKFLSQRINRKNCDARMFHVVCTIRTTLYELVSIIFYLFIL